MTEKLEDTIAKEITIEDIAKMKPLGKCKYYASDWVLNTVLWPGWLGGPIGTFVCAALSGKPYSSSYQGATGAIPFVLASFLSGAMVASAVRVTYNIARDCRKIKKVKEGIYEPKKVRG